MATEREKMLRGEMADTSDPAIQEHFALVQQACRRFNTLTTSDRGYRDALADLIPGVPPSSLIIPPFFCDYGDSIRLGKSVFINCGCVFLDGGGITIGDHVLIGPNVQIYTPNHPMDYTERRRTVEKSLSVTIGNDCWIGGSVVICPGVTIGDRSVIGAGSVVVKDIPPDSLAVGNPARVVRKLNGK